MSEKPEKIVLASGNAGKLKEFGNLFKPYGITVLPQSPFGIPECPEPYPTFVENALAKARHAAGHSGLPALADDSGICAAALNGAPGIHSARYAGSNPKSDTANNLKLAAELAGKPTKVVLMSAYWFLSVIKTTRARLSPRAYGTDNGTTRRSGKTVSVTTRIFICPNTAKPPPNWIRRSKTAKATARRHSPI